MLIRFSILLNFEKSLDFRDHRLLAWTKIMLTTRLLRYFKKSLVWRWGCSVQFSSVQFSHSVMSDSLWPHELQHSRPPSPSSTPRAHPNSCLLSRWCHQAISSCHPILLLPSIFPSIGSFQMSQLFASGGQSIGVSALISDLPMNTQDWSPLGWSVWISLQSKGLSRVFSNTTVQKHQFFDTHLSL